MKKEYRSPVTEMYEVIERHGILQETSGVIGADDGPAKENDFAWDDNGVDILWGDNPEEN